LHRRIRAGGLAREFAADVEFRAALRPGDAIYGTVQSCDLRLRLHRAATCKSTRARPARRSRFRWSEWSAAAGRKPGHGQLRSALRIRMGRGAEDRRARRLWLVL